jgi:hypothetical protein
MSEGLSGKEPRFNFRGLHVVIRLIGDELFVYRVWGAAEAASWPTTRMIECSESEKCKSD